MAPSMLNYFTLNKYGCKTRESVIIPAFHTFFENIKPSKLIKDSENRKIIIELAEKYIHFLFDNDVAYPLAIDPLYFEKRIYNQNSCFTVHGNKINGFDIENSERFIDSIVIDKNSRMELLIELNEAGISHGKIYPDLTGFCEEIKFKFSERFEELRDNVLYYLQ